jgi:hypothetical protein
VRIGFAIGVFDPKYSHHCTPRLTEL